MTECFANFDIVANLDQIICFSSSFDPGFSKSGSVYCIVGSNFDIVIDLDNTDLGNFMVASTVEHEAVTIAADHCAGMNDDPLPDAGALQNGGVRENDGIVADVDIVPHGDIRVQHDPLTNGCTAADDHSWTNRHIVAQAAPLPNDSRRVNTDWNAGGRAEKVQYFGKCKPGIVNLNEV
jgi:hypothetical protein